MTPVLAILSLHHPLLVRGGAQQSAYALFRHVAAKGVDCLFIAADPPGQGVATKAESFIRPSGLGANEYLFTAADYDFFWHRNNNAYAKRQLLDFLRDAGVTHVFLSHFMYFGLDMLPLMRDLGARVFAGFHEMLASCFADGHMITTRTRELCSKSAPERCAQCFPAISPDMFYLRNIHFQKCLQSAERFIVPSNFLRQRLSDWGLDPARFDVIWHGVDQSDFDARGLGSAGIVLGEPMQNRQPAPRAGAARFGYFGQLVDNKGLLILLEAAQMLEDREVGRFQIHINGANFAFASQGFREAYQRAIERGKSWKLGSIVDRGPYLHDTLPIRMAAVDVVVVPSLWWEIYCMVVDEAKFFGKPVIASAIGGIIERVEDGKDGYLVAPGDAYQLAEAMERIMVRPAKFAPQFPETQSWPAIAEQYMAVFFGPPKDAVQPG